MVLIRIFDLQMVGQGHELQHGQIRHWMDFFSGLQAGKNMADLSQSVIFFSTGSPM